MKLNTALCFFTVAIKGAVLAGEYPYSPAALNDVRVTGGFWLPRVETNRIVTVKTDFRKCEETGRIANFEKAARREKGGFKGVPWDDSDVFKVIEGASYTLAQHFIDMRGRKDLRPVWGAAYQDHVPVLEQKEALGHAVRATYLYAGMADVAALTGNAAYVNLFVESEATLKLACGEVKLSQKTDYPWNGKVRIEVARVGAGGERRGTRDESPETMNFRLNVRVPGWCVGRPVPSDLYTQAVPGSLADFTVKVNGKDVLGGTRSRASVVKGYCIIDREWKAGDVVEVSMNMPVKRIKAHDAVKNDRGRLAVERGPILYCAEGVDNDGHVLDKVLAPDAEFTPTTCDVLGNVYPAFTAPAVSLRRGLKDRICKEATTLKLIPYFAWCHRGAGEMQVFFPTEAKEEMAK